MTLSVLLKNVYSLRKVGLISQKKCGRSQINCLMIPKKIPDNPQKGAWQSPQKMPDKGKEIYSDFT